MSIGPRDKSRDDGSRFARGQGASGRETSVRTIFSRGMAERACEDLF